jgi:hypothetical protein
LRFHPTSPICAARALRDLELRLPRRGLLQRESTSLFVRADASPITAGDVDKLFKTCLKESEVPRNPNAVYSPHSFRRYLACALKAQHASDSTIQALLRWKTPESLKLYGILNDESYADLVDCAGTADVSSVRTNALPRAEMLDAAGRFHAARASLDAAAKSAQAKKPADDTADSDESEAAASSSDDDSPPPIQPPPPKRRRSGRQSTTPAVAPAPPPPLTIANALGRQVMVPASIWPDEPCHEHDGQGWQATITQVDRRLGAVFIKLLQARNAQGRRFVGNWLMLDTVKVPPS